MKLEEQEEQEEQEEREEWPLIPWVGKEEWEEE